jgi:hypothetical protein
MTLYKAVDYSGIPIDPKVLTKYVFAFLLGDGMLSKQERTNENYHYRVHQIIDHVDYVEWQANILSSLTKVRLYHIHYPDPRGWNTKAQISLRTNQTPFYTTLRERIYLNGIKRISPHDLKLLDAEALAIWYMDDGYINKEGNLFRVKLCTENYTFGDISLVQKVIYETTGISFSLQMRKLKNGYGHRLCASKDHAKRFIELVEPYILPSFLYKVDTSRTNSAVEETDDEIVPSV